jgi:hypothetical protein
LIDALKAVAIAAAAVGAGVRLRGDGICFARDDAVMFQGIAKGVLRTEAVVAWDAVERAVDTKSYLLRVLSDANESAAQNLRLHSA